MIEHPIIMSTPMVKAILEGRKTQTRRIIKPQPIIDQDSGSVFDGKYRKQYNIHNWQDAFIDDWSRCMPEDILWVREYMYQVYEDSVYYSADGKEWENQPEDYHYRNSACGVPSIHMPKEAARIWLEVTDIRVERLQDISEMDALAEGIYWQQHLGYTYDGENGNTESSVFEYAALWQKINGPESWIANPWVWCLEFKVLSTTGKPAQLLSKNILQESLKNIP